MGEESNDAVGGLQPLADRFGPAVRHRAGADARHRDAPAREREGDRAEFSDGGAAAFGLLRERVLAATRRLLDIDGNAAVPAFQARAPAAAAAAVAAIHAAQRWLAGAAGASPEPAVIDRAFALGLAEAMAILRDVGRWDAGVASWFSAVVACVEPA